MSWSVEPHDKASGGLCSCLSPKRCTHVNEPGPPRHGAATSVFALSAMALQTVLRPPGPWPSKRRRLPARAHAALALAHQGASGNRQHATTSTGRATVPT